MLNGIDPIIIFQFKALSTLSAETIQSKIPVLSEAPDFIDFPPIPIYFSDRVQNTIGILLDSEDKNVDIDTDIQTLTDGSKPEVNQNGLSTTVSIHLIAKKNSLSVAMLSSMIDLCFDKVTSKEYAISYLNGPITIFGGLLSSFSVGQGPENDLVSIKIDLIKGAKQPKTETPGPVVPGQAGTIPNAGAA